MSKGQTVQDRPVFAADIGGSFIKFAFSAREGAIEQLDAVPTPTRDWPQFVAALRNLLDKYPRGEGVPLALSIAGLVDPANGEAFAANIPAIIGHRLEQELREALDRPVFAANDADCLALAEALEGAGAGHAIAFCAILGTGVGGGLVIDGKLVRGAGGITGEWGHGPIVNTTLALDGRQIHLPRFACGCGQQGCVDTIGGARGLERLHQFFHQAEPDSRAILDLWQAGDAAAAQTVSAYLQLVADPLAAVVNVTGTSIIPVGGGLGSAHALIAALDQAVRQRILRRTDQALVVPGHFSHEGGLIGAAILGRQP